MGSAWPEARSSQHRAELQYRNRSLHGQRDVGLLVYARLRRDADILKFH
jgi:hypothetical protein